MTRGEMQRRARLIAEAAGAQVLLDEPLAPYLSMRVGGEAAALVRPPSLEALERVVRELREQALPVGLLGGGSNLLAGDGPLDLVVVHLAAAAGECVWDGGLARVPASLPLATLLRESARRELTGLEWAAGLPGSVGGAVVGNAGAFGGEMGTRVRELLLLEPDGSRRRRPTTAEDFGYRRSFVRGEELVLEVLIELEPGDPEEIRAEIARVNAARAASQPKGGHSFGCMFKNPEGDSAGRLIDSCGLKGRRRGGAVVSERHANFIVNDGSATARDILALMDEVAEQVERSTGLRLEREVRLLRSVGRGEGT